MEDTKKKKIKLVAIDLDGTLFNSDHKTSVETKKALFEATDAGLQIVFASGRNRVFMKELMDELGVDFPNISSGGGSVVESKEGRVIYSREVKLDGRVGEIVYWAENHQTGLACEYLDGKLIWYATNQYIENLDPGIQEYFKQSIRSNDPHIDFTRPFLKMSMTQMGEKVYSAEEMKALFPGLNFVYSGYNCVDLTANGVDKGSALTFLANHLGILLDEIAAIGDQTNDIAMLKIVGLPVAMGNAAEVVKEHAKWVAPTNDENGVAWALHEIISMNREIDQSLGEQVGGRYGS
jgi:Cof subfamily protein (haloacid dehalogenase superfamily)